MPIERKTAAIMFTDIAGYTEAMSESEQKALEMLRKKRSIIKPLIDNYKGTYVKEIGDGTLSYFESGYNASSCAKDLQKKLIKDDLNVRIGIHIGDIVFDNDDVYGDGVNIASRIESLAPAGGVLISKNVYDELINKDDFDGVPLGLQSLKGVGRLVEIYAIKDEFLVVPKPDDYKDTEIQIHKDDEVPSIAIIPFDNKGADEDVFYAYGICADLISDVTSAGLINVASLKDIEKLDYANLGNMELANKLFVRYIIQGTLWKMDDLFQISIELYDTKGSKAVWSDRWQENWKNLSTIQNTIADSITKVLDKTILGKSNIAINPEAYEYYLRAKHRYEERKTVEDTKVAQQLLKKSIEIDENLINAHILLGWSIYCSGDYDNAIGIYENTLLKARELNDLAGVANGLCKLGMIYEQMTIENNSLDYYQEALSLAKELNDKELISECFDRIGWIFSWIEGKEKDSTDSFLRSLEIRKEINNKSLIAHSYHALGVHYTWSIPKYNKALEYLTLGLNIQKEIKGNRGLAGIFLTLGLRYWHIGENEKALEQLNNAHKIFEELGEKVAVVETSSWIGLQHFENNNLNDALKFVEAAHNVDIELKDFGTRILSNTVLFLVRRELGLDNSDKELRLLEKELKSHPKRLHYIDNYYLYKLFGEKTDIETAYEKFTKKLELIGTSDRDELLNYPIPKAIVEEWEKVK